VRKPYIRSVASLVRAQQEKVKLTQGYGLYKLHNYLSQLEGVSGETYACIFYLSRYLQGLRSKRQLQIVKKQVDELAAQYNGRVFMAHHGDIICLCESVDKEEIRALAERIRNLFSEGAPYDHEGQDGTFYELHHLAKDMEDFARAVARISQMEDEYIQPQGAAKWVQPKVEDVVPLLPSDLSNIEEALQKISIGPLIHSQPVCSIDATESPKALYRELYISISDLQTALKSDCDFQENPWLFRYLTNFLDEFALAHFSQPSLSYSLNSIGLNLNIAAVLSPAFQKFESNIKEHDIKSIYIEFQKVDVFADMGAFLFARDCLKERGFKICLDGLTHLTLPFVDWEKLGFDFVKMYWSSEIKSLRKEKTQHYTLLAETIQSIRKNKVIENFILAHCDEDDAIKWGKEQGICYFQGWHIDKLLMPGFTETR